MEWFYGFLKKFPQNTRSFPEEKGNWLLFQKFSRALEESFKIPKVFQEF